MKYVVGSLKKQHAWFWSVLKVPQTYSASTKIQRVLPIHTNKLNLNCFKPLLGSQMLRKMYGS